MLSPKGSKLTTAAALAAILAASTAAIAQDGPTSPQVEKAQLPELEGSRLCPRGYAASYILVCDPGSRAPVEQIWNPAGVGVEICRASQPTCTPIAVSPNARPGFEVQDSTTGYSGSLVAVTFGLDRLLGTTP
jgi:hypothetical protein